MNFIRCDKCHLILIMEEVKDHSCKYKFKDIKFIDNIMWAFNGEKCYPVRRLMNYDKTPKDVTEPNLAIYKYQHISHHS